MKVVAFNGSPRGDGNTAILVRHVFAELQKEGIETEVVSLAGKPLRGCLACYKCYINVNRQCVQTMDALNGYVEKMIQAISRLETLGDVEQVIRLLDWSK